MPIVLSILLFAAIGAAVWLALRARAAQARAEKGAEEQAALRRAVAERDERLAHFSRLQVVVDAEAEAASLLASARRDADATLAAARSESERLTGEARVASATAAGVASRATIDAARLVEDARKAAEAEAQRMITEAHATASHVLSSASSSADQRRADAKRQYDALLVQAHEEAARAVTSAQATLSQATLDARRLVEAAQKDAQQIAGDALAAKANAERYEKTAAAMRNVIEGYGDRYVVPTTGLLDELAEEFGFAEAGQRLKAARQNTRAMIAAETAATCDYVEANRRTTAIAFVLDAFNGKVDTVLADVRDDNYGTLAKKIEDAYLLVNNHGMAFRNARVRQEYLAARLDELRWAVVAQELKAKEREEQRQIKERIREEERAQKEYERAIKEAQKEEETLRKAMEKARREVERAGDEQKAKFEAQLRELESKLHAAEEKNQRALSMAQLTKTGNVYVISNVGSFGDEVFKIGMTRRLDPLDRVRELGDASVPFEFDVHAMIASSDAPALEHALHKHFVRNQMNKVNPRKEFFRVSLQDIRAEVDRLGLNATWTMTAACREYRETQAIEQAMKSKTFDEAAWQADQLRREAGAARSDEREVIEA